MFNKYYMWIIGLKGHRISGPGVEKKLALVCIIHLSYINCQFLSRNQYIIDWRLESQYVLLQSCKLAVIPGRDPVGAGCFKIASGIWLCINLLYRHFIQKHKSFVSF